MQEELEKVEDPRIQRQFERIAEDVQQRVEGPPARDDEEMEEAAGFREAIEQEGETELFAPDEEEKSQEGMSINSIAHNWTSQRVSKGRWDSDEKRTEELMSGYERKAPKRVIESRDRRTSEKDVPGLVIDLREENDEGEQWSMDRLDHSRSMKRMIRQGGNHAYNEANTLAER